MATQTDPPAATPLADGLVLSTIGDDERAAFVRTVGEHFYEDLSDEVVGAYEQLVEPDRSYVVRDGARIVANYAVDSQDLSVPGGARLPCAAVTAVGVSSTHRRRGLMRAMMDRALDDAVERGEPVAALYASESPIYPRFGFGQSALTSSYRVDLTRLAFHERVEDRLVEHLDADAALTSVPTLYDSWRDTRPGAVGRRPGDWRLALVSDPEGMRDGATRRRLVHVPGRGVAAYRIKDALDGGLPAATVRLGLLIALDREAEQALWQHVTGVDLATTLTAALRPADDLLPWMVTDRMRLRSRDDDPLYTRLLDVERCLSSRTSQVEGEARFAVVDRSRDQSGTYRFSAGPDGSECVRSDATPEVTLPVEALAAVWLGGVRTSTLARAGRVEVHDDAALARLDALLASARAPSTPWMF